MIRSKTAGVAILAALALAGCGENPDATSHIRSVLGGEEAVAPASERAASADSAGTAAEVDPAVAEGAVEDGAPAAPPVLQLVNGDTLQLRESVVRFYRERDYRPAWTDDDEILPRGVSMLKAIGQANREGLDRERYHYGTALEIARLLNDDAVEDRELEFLGNLDLLLTENFARLSQDLVAGTIDPGKGDVEWRIERGEAAELELIESVIGGEDPQAVLATLRPEVPYYERMVEALARLRPIQQQGGWAKIDEGEALSEGDRDPRVAQLRRRLMSGGDPQEARWARTGQADPSLFDADLRKALEHFQARHTLYEDGALGPKTVGALNVPVEERIEALRLNLDRWRWLPNDLGDTFILVNVAGFELEVVRNDSAIESMNVVVGKTANRTPIFQDTLEYMVVNPYWNVPASIAEEEIYPAMQRDPSYLARNNMEMVRDGGAVRIRQRPGPGNALGNVKFLFPNSQNIYLHDTPADHLFSQETRAFSHGCIRVERPDDLARTLLAALTDRDPSDYDRLRQSGREQWIKFDEQIPVYILYFTAWVDEDGTMRFHPDIYDRDESLEGEARDKLGPVDRRPVAASQT